MDKQPVQEKPTAPKHSVFDVKALRQDVDALIQRLEAAFGSSRELALAKTKLEEAKMWAGKELANLGQELPAQFADKSQPGHTGISTDTKPDAPSVSADQAAPEPGAQQEKQA